MTTTDGATTGQNPTDELTASRQAVASAADAQAADAVSTLGLIQQARLANQSRALALAVAAYGKESTQAKTAAQAVTVTKAASARLAVLSQQVSTSPPTVAAAGWALHGRVYSSDLAPQAGYTVFLVDAQKNYLGEYGFAYTDATGYFLISVAGQKTDSGAAGAGAASQGATPAAAPATQGTSSAAQIFLQVADPNANPVLLSEKPFVPTTGRAAYQVLLLPAGGAKLGDPPAELRSVALPPIAAKSGAAKSSDATR